MDALSTSAQKIKHPKEVYRISIIVAMERFSYYGMVTLLIAYIVSQLHFQEHVGYAIFGTFAALSYGLPLFCGVAVDKILGKRKSVIWGTILHFTGLCLFLFPYRLAFYMGLAIFVCGSGFFSGVCKAFIGDFYHPDDTRGKDAGYTIFYGIFNAGVGLGAIVCGYTGQKINWQLGFATAAAVAGISIITFLLTINKEHGKPPEYTNPKKRRLYELLVYIITLPAIALVTFVFMHPTIMDFVLGPLTIVAFVYIIYLSFKYSKPERLKMYAAIAGFIVWILFLALYEQCSGSFNLFVLRNMDMHLGSINLPGLAINNFLPGFLPAILMPLMLIIWRSLNKAGREPGTILKFIISFVFMASFFAFFWWGCIRYSSTGMVPVYFLFGGYFLMELSELCLGPFLYALVHKLSPKNITASMMGFLGIASAAGEYLASKIGSLTAVPANITDPVKTLPYYTKIYGELALLAIGVAVLLTLFIPLFKRLMQDVR